MTTNDSRWSVLARELGPVFAERAAAYDQSGRFVAENYAELKRRKVFSALVPSDLGGGGASHAEICGFLRELAHYCGSTALALSMHTHLVAAAVWRFRHGQPAEALLRKIAAGELVLISTGAGDWVSSVGRAEPVPGGYRVDAVKRFASGCPAGDLMVTTAPCHDPARGAEVLHFPVPLSAEGVRVREDWDTLGMRATGSHTIELSGVFVPEESISLRRPQGQWHPSWNVVIGVAGPIYTAPYIGIAERAAQIALETARKRSADAIAIQSVGELENTLCVARMAHREMVGLTDDFAFEPVNDIANAMLMRKTIAANAAVATVEKALEVVGGSGYFRVAGLERLIRDVKGAPFHPLPEKRQLEFTGRVALGLPPVG